MKKVVLSFLMSISILVCSAQGKLIRKLLSNEKDTTRKASFMPVPVLGYAQETGVELGLGAIYSLYLDRKDTLNRSSNFYGMGSYSTKGTYSVTLKGDVWTKGNKHHLIGDIRFKDMPFNFYGLGNNTLAANEDKLVQRSIKMLFDAEKSFVAKSYSGVSLGFENYSFTDKMADGIFAQDPLIFDKDGGSVVFIGVSQSLDTRNSNNFPTKGFFGRISYQYAPDIFGGDNFKGSQLKLNLRSFWSFTPKIVLGVQAIYHTVQSNHTPFYMLPQLGNDEIMRGYYAGRYRDENLLQGQAELRYRFMNRFAFVAFAGLGKVFNNHQVNLNDFKPNYGVGGRYFFDTAKGLSVRFDYGVGEKRPGEKRQTGFYIGLGEAF